MPNVSNLVYEISKLLSDAKEMVEDQKVYDIANLYPFVMSEKND